MSDYSEGMLCPMCGCSVMDGTRCCWACGWGVEEFIGPEDEEEDDEGVDYVGGP